MKQALAKVERLIPVKTVHEKLSERAEVEFPVIIKAMKDDEFRNKLKTNSKEVLEAEFSGLLGKPVKFPNNFTVKVLEETDDIAYLVIPRISNPAELPSAADLDRDAGVAHYCTSPGCKPGWSC